MITLGSDRLFRPFVSSISFSALLSNPTVGKYDFGTASNAGVPIFDIQPNTVYFVDSLEIAGNIPGETFLSAIDTLLYLTFKRSLSNEIVYSQKIPINLFSTSKSLSGFVLSAKGGENLVADLIGVLSSVDDLIGVNPVIINVGLNVYAIDERNYNRDFRKG